MNEKDDFCEDCPFIDCVGGMDYAYGAPLLINEITCRAEMDPEDPGCPRHEAFYEFLKEREGEE